MIKENLEKYFIAFNNSLAVDDVLLKDKEKLSAEHNKFLDALNKLKQEYNFDVLQNKFLQSKCDLENNTRKMRYNYLRIITDAIYYADTITSSKYYNKIIRYITNKYHIKVDTCGEQYNVTWHDYICATTEYSNCIYNRSDNHLVFEDVSENFYIVAPHDIDLDMFVKDLEEYCKILNTQKDANEYQEYLRLKEKYEKQS